MDTKTCLTRRLVKVGNSLAIFIPRAFVHELGLERGDEVKVYLAGRVLAVQRVDNTGWTPGVIAVPPAPRLTFAEEEEHGGLDPNQP